MGLNEFDFIARYFKPLAGPGSLDLDDDAALIDVRPNTQLIVSTDTLVESVHFLSDDPPETVGQKLLRTNLSDCAAMGAKPLGYLLNLSRPSRIADDWFADFSRGLLQDQKLFNVTLLGGNTSSITGPLVLSLTIIGEVIRGQAIGRAGARIGDDIWVTGTLGDSVLGLKALRGEIADPDGYLVHRYRITNPRVGFPLYGMATAAVDISDGLTQDASHIAQASHVGIEIWAADIPTSTQARAQDADYVRTSLTGGGDYELLFTSPPSERPTVLAAGRTHGVQVTRIGQVVREGAVRVIACNGQEIFLKQAGWKHF